MNQQFTRSSRLRLTAVLRRNAGANLLVAAGLTFAVTLGACDDDASLITLPTNGGSSASTVVQAVYVADSLGDTVSVFAFDNDSGELTPVAAVGTCAEPIGLAVHPGGPFLYVACETAGQVAGYAIDPDTYDLTPVPNSPFASGFTARKVVVHPSGDYVYSANGTSNNVRAYTVDGATGELGFINIYSTTGTTSPWALAIDPGGNYVYAPTQSSSVAAWAVNSADGTLSDVTGTPFSGGFHWDATVDGSGSYLYTSDEGSVRMHAYSIGGSGQLTPLTGSPYSLPYSPRGVAVDPTGSYLYAPGSDGDRVMWWELNGDGSVNLASQTEVFAGQDPDGLEIGPSGEWVFVTNPTDNTLAVFDRDPADGSLTERAGPRTPTGSGPRDMALLLGTE